MQYLRIANPGLADMNALMVLGVSTSRWDSGTIGQFGTGSKFSIALLLRNGIAPEVYVGGERMKFFTTSLQLQDGSDHQQVNVRLKGKSNKTVKLSYTTGLGECDWTELRMAVREFVSNAIDGCSKQGLGVDEVMIDVVDNPRAIRGGNHTAVFIPLTPEINKIYMELPDHFLHFRKNLDLDRQILPKVRPDRPDQTRIYKSGVLVHVADIPSSFDYNVVELKLDESRNASVYDVRSACAEALKKCTEVPVLTKLVSDVCDGTDKAWFEKELDGYYLTSKYSDDAVREARGNAWQAALENVFGPYACAVTSPVLNDSVKYKGYTPVNLPANFGQLVVSLKNVRCDTMILNGLERKGRVEIEASENMRNVLDYLWKMIQKYDMTNGKEKPKLKAFKQNMESGCQTNGEYENGEYDDNGIVWLRWDLDNSHAIRKTTLEELAHHCSGATDMSRDFQEWILRFTTYVIYNEGV